MSAKFIVDNEIKYICNICTDTVKEDKIIALKCEPSKHIFCYDCILDWYKSIKNSNNYGNYPIKTMCPICRKNGGLLPLIDGIQLINGIHNSKNTLICTTIKLCGASLKSKNSTCKSYGNPLNGGFCGRHKHLVNQPIIENTNELHVPKIKANACGYKLLSKAGLCSINGNDKYGGLCSRHFKIKNSEINITDNVVVV